jgi:hypothetical protein
MACAIASMSLFAMNACDGLQKAGGVDGKCAVHRQVKPVNDINFPA